MSMDDSAIKKPESYGIYGTVLGRPLLPSEAHGNLDVLIGVLNNMLGSLTPAKFGARYGDATKKWAPKGKVYKQYPGMPSAPDLYLGTWEYYGQAGSSYASRNGRVERAEGGNALAFEGGEQLDAMQGHGGHVTGVSTAPFTSRQWNPAYGNEAPQELSGYGTPKIAIETRMINDTVRIWVCVNAPQ